MSKDYPHDKKYLQQRFQAFKRLSDSKQRHIFMLENNLQAERADLKKLQEEMGKLKTFPEQSHE